jgi:1-deoxy-D-xylulose-5-phosphate reductoisomerase
MSQVISLLGSTGSIGRQSLEVIAACGMSVCALTANHNVELLEQQIRQFHPRLAVCYDKAAAEDLKVRVADLDVTVLSGMEGLLEAAVMPEADTVITAVMGMVGLRPTLAAIREKKRIALANKETLVCAGELVMDEAQRCGAEIVPVDSEHSALFQCIQGCKDRGEIKRLLLTASGGPFFGKTRQELEGVTRKDALKHPNWAMGAKITIDSATMMNKGLEFIEAMRLYRVSPEKISILVHRQSIVHSLVEYHDNAVMAQLGAPDMRLPIQYALTYPARTETIAKPLDLLTCPPLTFEAPDLDTFRCLKVALDTARIPGAACAILNGANEEAVAAFLADKVGFLQIADLVEEALQTVPNVVDPTLEDILAADAAARDCVRARIS